MDTAFIDECLCRLVQELAATTIKSKREAIMQEIDTWLDQRIYATQEELCTSQS